MNNNKKKMNELTLEELIHFVKANEITLFKYLNNSKTIIIKYDKRTKEIKAQQLAINKI